MNKKEELKKIYGECRVCGEKTDMIVNINFKATPICDSCCNSIAKQHIVWLINYRVPELEEKLRKEKLKQGDKE